jgi:tetratricopeptide (TPR) repeat protein
MTADQPFISFCAIVKNEAENLPRCLASVQPYVDELIVVDTGSTDETTAIAQQYNAKVSHFEWCDDFAAARNHALSLVSGDWILTLDADEELVVRTQQFRERLVQPHEPLAYAINRNDLYEVDQIAGGLHLRLYRNLPGLHYVGRYHEQLQWVGGQSLSIERLEDIEILHYGNSDENILSKNLTRDIPILEKMRSEEGLDLWRLDCLARKYLKVHQLEQAQHCYEEALDRLAPHLQEGQPPEPFFWVPTLLEALGSQALETEDFETLQLICQRGLEWCPNHPPLNFLAGDFLLLLGFPEGAISYFQYCLQMGQDKMYYRGDPVPMSFVQAFPAYGLGCAYLALNQPSNASQAFQMALTFDPNYQAAREKIILLEEFDKELSNEL